MFSIWTLVAITLTYIAFLFIIATLGNKVKKLPKSVYSLALGIHCTSWAFFGTTTQATQFGWALVPTYLGIILVMMFGFPLLLRINNICKQYKITSIAEFIGVRYEHSNLIATIVTLICFIGVIPYIALQLNAISTAINLLVEDSEAPSLSVSLYVAIAMAFFAIWFGARRMNLVEHNKGLMLTIATQSVVKLTCLLIIGIYVVYSVFDGFIDLFSQSVNQPLSHNILEKPSAYWIYASHILLGICSMFCLPRQFHVNFVESRSNDELKQARWLFPAYLTAMSIFVLPIALAGNLMLNQSSYATDTYVLAIPIALEQHLLAIVGFIGGFAAASSMVIVATLALGNMVTNSVITPLLLHLKQTGTGAFQLSGDQILRTRQLTILVMLFIAYWYHVYVSESTTLVETGTIAISLLSQTFPAIVLGIYWHKANRYGVICGLVLGVSIIISGMLYPAIMSVTDHTHRLGGNEIANVLFSALFVNALSIVVVSIMSKNHVLNNRHINPYNHTALPQTWFRIPYAKLVNLTDKLLPAKVSQEFKQQMQYANLDVNDLAPQNIIFRAQNTLSAHVGSASSRILLNAISDNNIATPSDMYELVAQAGKDFQFNKEILQASITHLPLGISVVDAELKLVAWNRLYERFFDYPDGFLHIGKPIIDILQFNASRGLFGKQPHTDEIQKRMHNMLIGRSYKVVRPNLFDQVIEISGHPLPAGGFITCYSNITEYIDIQNALEQSKSELEDRVLRRTAELEQAKDEAVQANISKTKFLAATSHDLMQPLNAASLFASMLTETLTKSSSNEVEKQKLEAKLQTLASSLLSSLDNAEALISTLIEVTKLENKQIKPNMQAFNLGDLLQSLANEYQLIFEHKPIKFIYVKTNIWVYTDRRLLTRIIQNLLSNALRYTTQGKVLLGVRRRKHGLCDIIVADTGPGIEQAYQDQIFEEFTRLQPNDDHTGLGLGLTIVKRISALLKIDINLQSQVNKGSSFCISLGRIKPLKDKVTKTVVSTTPANDLFLANKTVLLLENDLAVSQAVSSLLSLWGANVKVAADKDSVKNVSDVFDLIVADYHLNNGDTGVEVSLFLQNKLNAAIPIILSSADRSEEIQALAYEHGMRYLPKPIKQAALKRLIQRALN